MREPGGFFHEERGRVHRYPYHGGHGSQGGNNNDTLKYRISDPKLGEPTLETTRTTVRAGVAQPIQQTIEPLTGGVLGLDCADIGNPACDGNGSFAASADNQEMSAQALTDLPGIARAGLRWGGITSIKNQFGQEIIGQASVTSGSGVDYLNEIQAVPAPATLPLLLTALTGLAGRVRRRGQQRARWAGSPIRTGYSLTARQKNAFR